MSAKGMLTGAVVAGSALAPEDAKANWTKRGLDEAFNMWHGGGDFENLDLSFVRSGEGTQAYSQGFYGADRRGTSEGYADQYKNKAQYALEERITEFEDFIYQNSIKEFSNSGYKDIYDEVIKIANQNPFLSGEEAKNLLLNYRRAVTFDGRGPVDGRNAFTDNAIGPSEYAERIVRQKLRPEYSTDYYLKPRWMPDENQYEPAVAETISEAAEMARTARERDGITKEQYAKIKNININEAVSEVEGTINKALETIEKRISEKIKIQKPYLYNIEFPNLKRENFMMWDMSISKQPKVKELFKSISDKIDSLSNETGSIVSEDMLSEQQQGAIEIFQDIANGAKVDEDMLKEIQQYALVSRREMQGIENLNDVSAGVAVWLLEGIFGAKETAQLLSQGGIKASSHFDRGTRNKYRTVPFNQREDIPENTYNHVIYEEMPISILSKEQKGNADPRLLAAMAASGGTVSAVSQVNDSSLTTRIKSDPLIQSAIGLFSGAAQGAIDSIAPMGRPVNPYNPIGQSGVLTKQQLKSTPEIERLKESVTGGSKTGQFIGSMFSPI